MRVALLLWLRLVEHEAGEPGFEFLRVFGESKVDEAVSSIFLLLKLDRKVDEIDLIKVIVTQQREDISSGVLIRDAPQHHGCAQIPWHRLRGHLSPHAAKIPHPLLPL